MDKSDLGKKNNDADKKIPDISGFVLKKTDYNAKTTKIEGKTPSITGLATIAALTVVENKIPNVLVKKDGDDGKITDIASKYITKADFNKVTKDIVAIG